MKVQDKFKESLVENNLSCNNKELEDYLDYGLVLKQGKDYYDRELHKLNIKYPSLMSINLSTTINNSIALGKNKYVKRVYCMTEKSYNKYKEKGYIITKDNDEYYRLYSNEEWLVYVLK